MPEEYQALFLFGSYARGDQTPQSDIDILAVVAPSYIPPLPIRLGLCFYTQRQLLRMAERGSLFVLHLIHEAKSIYDPQNFLDRLRETYRPSSLRNICDEVEWSAKLLTTDSSSYREKREKYNRLVINLIRTFAFAKVADMGNPYFSMSKVASLLSEDWLSALPSPEKMEWPTYIDTLRRLNQLSGANFHNPYDSTEALISNAWYKSSMCVGMGLKLLSDDPNLVYEDADLRWLIDD